jgi:hypothetical protein
MGTSVSLGNYEPEEIKEPWEESQYRELFRAYYTQSLNMNIDGLLYCITALTSLELNKCYTDSEKNGVEISESPRNCYLSALTIYIDNKGQIIKGEKVLTKFKLIYDASKKRHILDTSFKVRQEIEDCIDGKDLHIQILKKKQITFKNGKIYILDKFHEYIFQASLCNRRTDVNYTNMKVMANREEMNKTLNLLGIGLSSIGFLPGRATAIADTSIKILALALTIEPRVSIAEYTIPIKGPVYLDEITVIQNYKQENTNGYVSPQRKIGEPRRENKDILKILEEWGLKIKK